MIINTEVTQSRHLSKSILNKSLVVELVKMKGIDIKLE